jgi:hypothetical protein
VVLAVAAENANRYCLSIATTKKIHNTMPCLSGCGIVAFGIDEFLLEIIQKMSVVGYVLTTDVFYLVPTVKSVIL